MVVANGKHKHLESKHLRYNVVAKVYGGWCIVDLYFVDIKVQRIRSVYMSTASHASIVGCIAGCISIWQAQGYPDSIMPTLDQAVSKRSSSGILL